MIDLIAAYIGLVLVLYGLALVSSEKPPARTILFGPLAVFSQLILVAAVVFMLSKLMNPIHRRCY